MFFVGVTRIDASVIVITLVVGSMLIPSTKHVNSAIRITTDTLGNTTNTLEITTDTLEMTTDTLEMTTTTLEMTTDTLGITMDA